MSTLSPHTLITRAVFGLSALRHPTTSFAHEREALQHAAHLLRAVRDAAPSTPHSTFILLSGPSGSGKSSLLRALRALLADHAPQPILNLSRPAPPERATLIDHLSHHTRSGWSHIAKTLTRLGLGQPALWLSPLHALSDGERSRARLADALLTAQSRSSHPIVIIDEFLSLLDRPTAISILSGTRRILAESPPTLLVAASAHHDLAQALEPHASLVTHISQCRASILFSPRPRH